MIAEAIDTAVTLGWAFLVAVACACRAVWRGVTAALAALQRLNAPELLPEPHEPPHAHTAPSWAKHAEEAA